MISIKELRTRLSAGSLDQDLSRLRCVSGEALTSERRRLSDVLDQFCAAFGSRGRHRRYSMLRPRSY